MHLALKKDFSVAVDYDCIEQALRAVAPDVRRSSYVPDAMGPRGFERGITVTQFNYGDPSFRGGYTLDVAVQSDGNTHYWHEWSKIGTKIPPEEQRAIVPLLLRANRSVERKCGLSFTGIVPEIGDG